MAVYDPRFRTGNYPGGSPGTELSPEDEANFSTAKANLAAAEASRGNAAYMPGGSAGPGWTAPAVAPRPVAPAPVAPPIAPAPTPTAAPEVAPGYGISIRNGEPPAPVPASQPESPAAPATLTPQAMQEISRTLADPKIPLAVRINTVKNLDPNLYPPSEVQNLDAFKRLSSQNEYEQRAASVRQHIEDAKLRAMGQQRLTPQERGDLIGFINQAGKRSALDKMAAIRVVQSSDPGNRAADPELRRMFDLADQHDAALAQQQMTPSAILAQQNAARFEYQRAKTEMEKRDAATAIIGGADLSKFGPEVDGLRELQTALKNNPTLGPGLMAEWDRRSKQVFTETNIRRAQALHQQEFQQQQGNVDAKATAEQDKANAAKAEKHQADWQKVQDKKIDTAHEDVMKLFIEAGKYKPDSDTAKYYQSELEGARTREQKLRDQQYQPPTMTPGPTVGGSANYAPGGIAVQPKSPSTQPEAVTPAAKSKPMDLETAKLILLEVGGDNAKARARAIQLGYSF